MLEQIKKGVMTGIGMGLLTNEKILEYAIKRRGGQYDYRGG